LQCYLLC